MPGLQPHPGMLFEWRCAVGACHACSIQQGSNSGLWDGSKTQTSSQPCGTRSPGSSSCSVTNSAPSQEARQLASNERFGDCCNIPK